MCPVIACSIVVRLIVILWPSVVVVVLLVVGIGSAWLVLPCVVVVVGRGAMVDVVGLGVLVVVFPAWRSSS